MGTHWLPAIRSSFTPTIYKEIDAKHHHHWDFLISPLSSFMGYYLLFCTYCTGYTTNRIDWQAPVQDLGTISNVFVINVATVAKEGRCNYPRGKHAICYYFCARKAYRDIYIYIIFIMNLFILRTHWFAAIRPSFTYYYIYKGAFSLSLSLFSWIAGEILIALLSSSSLSGWFSRACYEPDWQARVAVLYNNIGYKNYAHICYNNW